MSNTHDTTHAVRHTSGTHTTPDEAHAAEVAAQAGRWLAFATERSRMRPGTLLAKALASATFSTLHRASSLAVPSKLVGTAKHQRALWALVRDPADPWAELRLGVTNEAITASLGDEALGSVQAKHVPWVRPLVPFGLTAHLARVTGSETEGYTLGANVVLGHVGRALDRLLDALGGADGPSAGGDGATAEPPPASLRLVVRPEADVLRPGYDAQDVVLYRHLDGTACASVAHIPRHSPTGIEWGYAGSGPADLARSVLLALTDEPTAEALYQAFKAEVIARVPHAGGVLRAADVRAWVAAQTDRPTAA
ncbi:DUF6166 domain-containing protein [Rubrivirga marina]|uniref:DUF6166 domain-containing protein n=1 Tax=Rubrivirga marina TaxID=1196024 RepID=UPI000BA98602|nr:DUF6166 domain-containing protein [Rubrivirga marina]